MSPRPGVEMPAGEKTTMDSGNQGLSASTEVRRLEVLEEHCCLEVRVGSE